MRRRQKFVSARHTQMNTRLHRLVSYPMQCMHVCLTGAGACWLMPAARVRVPHHVPSEMRKPPLYASGPVRLSGT